MPVVANKSFAVVLLLSPLKYPQPPGMPSITFRSPTAFMQYVKVFSKILIARSALTGDKFVETHFNWLRKFKINPGISSVKALWTCLQDHPYFCRGPCFDGFQFDDHITFFHRHRICGYFRGAYPADHLFYFGKFFFFNIFSIRVSAVCWGTNLFSVPVESQNRPHQV